MTCASARRSEAKKKRLKEDYQLIKETKRNNKLKLFPEVAGGHV